MPEWYRKGMLKIASRLRRFVDRRIIRLQKGEERPAFYDVDADFPALRKIDENYDTIREELLAVMPRTNVIPRYHEIDPYQEEVSAGTDEAWRILYLYLVGSPIQPNQALCPRTIEIIRSIPNVMDAFFSILEPKKCVPAHRGTTMANLRYHTAFIVPENNPPTIRVKDSFHTWKERTSVFFDDSLEHEVMNESDGPRVVLIVDVWRPLPWHLATLNLLTGWVTRQGISRAEWEEVARDRSLAPAATA